MSQEKVREILSHVDMTKIDLSSFRLSEMKFDELSHLYRNRVILSCVGVVVQKDKFTKEEVDSAFDLLKKVTDNPNIYSYAHIYATERQAVDDAINDITTNRNRSINDVKLKAIEKRIKDAYKHMRRIIQLALENGNTFEDEFDENVVEKCLQITKKAIDSGYQKAAEEHVATANVQEPQVEQVESVVEAKHAETSESVIAKEACEEKPRTKVGFWKRIFGKAS